MQFSRRAAIDATLSIQEPRPLIVEFSRAGRVRRGRRNLQAPSRGYAQRQHRRQEVLRWRSECDLVTPSEIAPGESAQTGNSSFNTSTPSAVRADFHHRNVIFRECMPLWAWCAVGSWLVQNDIPRPEEGWNAEVVAAINNSLEAPAPATTESRSLSK